MNGFCYIYFANNVSTCETKLQNDGKVSHRNMQLLRNLAVAVYLLLQNWIDNWTLQ